MHQIPMSTPPTLVHSFGAFGESIHGLAGPEPYRNGFWVLNIATGGSGTLEFGGVSYPFAHGSAVLAPPDVSHVYRFDQTTTKTFAHFRMDPTSATAPFPVVQGLSDRLDWFRATLLECRSLVSLEPERCLAALWNLLWQLAAGPVGGSTPRHHPAIRGLLSYLEVHIQEPLDPEVAALHAGCSVSHLNRLCHSAFGLPLAAYVRRLRLDRAVHLLTQTDARVAEVAARVGIPDLQHFNKLIRAHTGRSPRNLQQRG